MIWGHFGGELGGQLEGDNSGGSTRGSFATRTATNKLLVPATSNRRRGAMVGRFGLLAMQYTPVAEMFAEILRLEGHTGLPNGQFRRESLCFAPCAARSSKLVCADPWSMPLRRFGHVINSASR